MFEMRGGMTKTTDFVVLYCTECKEGVDYWDKEVHGWPDLDQVNNTAMLHIEAVH